MGSEIVRQRLGRLVFLESLAQYEQNAPKGVAPFLLIQRQSPILLSAPHGALTYRNEPEEEWHPQDTYTAGMALLLGELCQIPVLATLYCTPDSDPNHHDEAHSPYKRALRQAVNLLGVRCVLDLHGVRTDHPRLGKHLVDLGTRRQYQSAPEPVIQRLKAILEKRLGPGSVSRNRIPALSENRITAFCQQDLEIYAMQIEMKPEIRVPENLDSPEANLVHQMIDALVEFIEFFKENE